MFSKTKHRHRPRRGGDPIGPAADPPHQTSDELRRRRRRRGFLLRLFRLDSPGSRLLRSSTKSFSTFVQRNAVVWLLIIPPRRRRPEKRVSPPVKPRTRN